jgi:hypothetical protein
MSEEKRPPRHGASQSRPAHWPDGVYLITVEGMGLMGVHEDTGQLFWDGKEIVTKQIVRLRGYEVFLATLAAIGTFGVFALESGKLVGWW